jgi:nucleotide-binding universal stress UspA family protein
MVDRGAMNTEARDVPRTTISPGSIVVGVDGSEHAARALDWAARQAALEHRPLTLLHAFNPVARTTLGALELEGTDRYELLRELRRAARVALDDATVRVHEIEPGVTVQTCLLDGDDARHALVEASRTAHLLVVGSHGRGALRGLLLGSVSVAVAQLAACPVVVCRPRHGDPDTHGVLVGVDGSPESVPVIDFAFQQASLRGVPLTVMHCYWEIVAQGRAAPRALENATDMELLLAESVAGFAETYPDVEVRLELSRGLVDQVLAQAAPETDLLVVGRRHKAAVARLLHASMAAAVLERAAGTVAVVPEAEHSAEA